ncbi:Ig-like domain repeat protein [bacterium]|nr:Ig-like domain repeat protein [bacterium]
MLNKHPILILLFVMLTSLAFATGGTTITDVTYSVTDADDAIVADNIARFGDTVEFTVNITPDGNITQVRIFTDDLADLSYDNPLILTPETINVLYKGTYTVSSGNVNNTAPGIDFTVEVYDGGASPIEETHQLKIDNRVFPTITASNSTWIEFDGDATKDFVGIGDEVTFKFRRAWNPTTTDVDTVYLDLSSLGVADEVMASLSAGVFSYSHTLAEGDIANDRLPGPTGYLPVISIPIRMINTHGVESLSAAGDVISGKSNGDPVGADTAYPSVPDGSNPVAHNDQYRFSPQSVEVTGWDSTPNDIKGKITIPNFGDAGQINTFYLQVQNENTDEVYSTLLQYTHGDADVQVSGDDVIFTWDGTIPGHTIVNGIYGFTLKKIADAAGNEVVYTPQPEVANPLLSAGNSLLNAVDWVVDNVAPEFKKLGNIKSGLQVLDTATNQVPTNNTITRNINEGANDPSPYEISAGDSFDSIPELYFTFDVKRDFSNDTEQNRKELVKYWIEVSQGATKKYFYPGAGLLGENAEVKTDVDFVATQAFANVNSLGTMPTFKWKASDWTIYPEGDWTVTAYIQDNAGNIKTSSKTITIEDSFFGYSGPIVSQSNIGSHDLTSSHAGGFPTTYDTPNNWKQFYVNSTYQAGPDQGEIYFTNDTHNNVVTFRVRVNGIDQAEKVVFDANDPALPSAFNTQILTADFEAIAGSPNSGFAVLTVPMSAFDEDDFLAGSKEFTFGQAGTDLEISVMTRTVGDDPVGGQTNPYDLEVYAAGIKRFKVNRPEEPSWPTITSNVIANPYCLSPGNPSYAYDSVTNPANDGTVSSNQIEFEIGTSNKDYNWTLAIRNPVNNRTFTETGSYTANGPAVDESIQFYNLTNNFLPLVAETSTGLLDVVLTVNPVPYTDGGYVAPEALTSTATTKVDNQNPGILNADGSALVGGYLSDLNEDGNTYYVTNNTNTIELPIKTSEPLRETGWTGLVFNQDLYNVLTGSSVSIVAEGKGTPVTLPTSGEDAYSEFDLTITLAGIPDQAVNNVLVLRAPNDFGGNPGRQNDPPFPYGADAWYHDSAEAYLRFIHLTNDIEVVSTNFYHINSIDDEVSNRVNEEGEFKFVVEVSSYNAIVPAESNLRGVEDYLFDVYFDDFASVNATTSAVLNGDGNWEITYAGDYTVNPLSYSSGDYLDITGTLAFSFETGDNAVHRVNFAHENLIRFDNTNPLITVNSVPNFATEGTNYVIRYNISDLHTGIMNPSVRLSCPELGITNMAYSSVTGIAYQWNVPIPANFSTNTINFDIVAKDRLDNESGTSTIVDIFPMPTVSNVIVENVQATQHADHGNHQYIIENNNKVIVKFNLTQVERIDGVSIELNNGTDIDLNAAYVAANFSDGVNTYEFTDFGTGTQDATLRATVTIDHPYQHYADSSSANSLPTSHVPFVDNNQVDITDIAVFVNGVETNNYFTLDSSIPFEIRANVITYAGHLDNNDVVLSYNGAVAGNPTSVQGPVFQTVKPGYVKYRYTYTWNNGDFNFANFQTADLASDGYDVYSFEVNARSNYNFVAVPYSENLVGLAVPAYTFNGINNNRYSGIDPEGWFAPEHDVKLTMQVNSVLADVNPIADFDNITNNFPDVQWVLGDDDVTLINVNGITIYIHEITWIETPDVQACWNHYDDGEQIDVDIRYNDFFNPNPIELVQNIKIDLEVPVYEDGYFIVKDNNNTSDYAVADGIIGLNAPLNPENRNYYDLTLDASGDYFFEGHIYVKKVINDLNGVSLDPSAIPLPTISAGWTAEYLGTQTVGTTLEAIWKFSPVLPTDVENIDLVEIQFNQLEDLVGHLNYSGDEDYNSPSNRYEPYGPTIGLGFESSDADTNSIIGFQYDGLDRMNTATRPFVSSGNNIGLILNIEPQPNDSPGVTITNVEIDRNNYNGLNQGWVALAYDAVEDVYYLNTNVVVNKPVGPLAVDYRITYSTNQVRTGRQTGVFQVVDGSTTEVVAMDVWSETLGENGMYYVTPGDTDAHIRMTFTSTAPLANTTAQAFATFMDFNTILDVAPSFNVDATWDSANNLWVAEIGGLTVRDQHSVNPLETSSIVKAKATSFTGLVSAESDKILSFAGGGPIVPLIKHAQLVTSTPNGDAINYLAINGTEVINATLEVYINTEYKEYIDDIEIEDITGLTIGQFGPTTTVAIDPLLVSSHGANWLATFPVTIVDPSQFTEDDAVDFDITSIRNPFANVLTNPFEHEVTVTAIVDGNDFDVALNNPGTQNPVLGNFEFSFDFTNFGETFDPAFAPALTDFVVSSNELVNDLNPTTFNGNVASLTIDASDFTAAAANLGNTDFTVTYTNIYGFEKSETQNILLDATAPRPIVNNAIEFVSADGNSNYDWDITSTINNNQNWTALRVNLEDPAMFGTDGVGINNANIVFALGTVTPSTNAFTNVFGIQNGNAVELRFNGNYSAYDLAEGNYTITVTATDNLDNSFTQVQELRYSHSPATVVATTAPGTILNSGNVVDLEFLVHDPNTVVNKVGFEVYYDANNDTDNNVDGYVLDPNDIVVPLVEDTTYPYGFNWDLTTDRYTQYLANANYGTSPRYYYVRVLTTSTTMRSVSEEIFMYAVADVTAPEVTDVLAAGLNSIQVVYDYITPANNNINITALVGTWIDVDYVELTINGDVFNYDLVTPVNWTYDADDIGEVVITAKAYDFMGNESLEADFSTVLTIVNPSYDKFYNLTLIDYENYNSILDNTINNGTIYSPNNDLTTNDVRLYALYPNGLDGIAEIQFFVNRIETATGNVLATLPVNNNNAINPQYGNDNIVYPANCYDATADVWNSWITVDSNLYTNNGNFAGTDYSYEFYAVLIDSYTTVEVIPQAGIVNSDANFRVDYLKPELTVNNASVTHTSYAYYDGTVDRLVFDYVDYVNDPRNVNDYVVDFNGVNVADNANITIDALTNTVSIPWTGLDEIELEGIVTYTVTVTDFNGNVSVGTPIDVYVDNLAPQTEIANLKYLTDVDHGGDAMNNFHVFDGNPIHVMADNSQNLTIQIDKSQILGLSNENTVMWRNRIQPWYFNNDDDIYPPVKLYSNIDNAGWNLIAYDHEVNASGMYEFNITVDTGDVVEYAVIAEDTRGNVEGDVVLRDALGNVIRPLNGLLEADELDNAVNLTVNVLYPVDITTTIVNHNVDDVISGLTLLTANVATPANIVSVDFQYSDGTNWISLGTDDSMVDVAYEFNYNSAALPYFVPGVHVELTGAVTGFRTAELANNNGIWSILVNDLARDTYDVKYYVDINNDGVIDANERANYEVKTDAINADGYAFQFDTTTIPDGSYLFRAVPFDNLDATDDQAAAVEMNLIIDNTAPAFDFTALNFVMLDTYKTLAENVEFSLAYANPNDVHTVQAWLVDVNNPANTYILVNDVYAAYDVRPTDFSVVLAGIPDGNYYLEVTVQDFVFNVNNQTPALGDDLHIDTNAPVITAVNNALNMSGIYTETHQFTVAYNDYLAQLLDANGDGLGIKALEATFTHNSIVDVVDVKVSDDGAMLVFDWTPSQAMMNEVINGQDNILVNVDVALTDHNDYVSAIFNAGNFTLRSAEVGAKIMVVSDFRNGTETYHQTSVTNNNEITDVIGGNNINMFAFLPEGNNVIDPNNVRFEYWDGTNWIQFAASAVWNPIANFAGTGTISGYAKYMEVNWNIANMDGDYTVRTVSEYNFGEVVNETNLHIWNSTIVPEITVSTLEGVATTEVNRGSEYLVSIGNFTSTHPEFFNQVNYMYRFLDENDNVASPWNQLSGFIANEYNWTIGMDYLFAEKVQIAVQIENIFNNVADQASFIANGGIPYVVDIVDSDAPMITDLTVTQAGNPVAIDSWVANNNALDIAITVDNAVLDLSSIVIALDGTEVNAVAYDTNNQVDPTIVNYTLDISTLTTGTYQIEVTTADFVAHTYNEVFGFSVDTDAPTSALVLEENDNGYIERDLAYTFNANAMDNVTAIEDLTINYFWSLAGADVWTPIVLDVNNQWIIPNNWLMNESYDFKAEVTDEYTNVSESMVTYQVRDNVTVIAINNVNNIVASNGVHFNGDVEIELTVGADVTEINSWVKAPGATDWNAPLVLPVDPVTGIANFVFSPTVDDVDGIYTFGFGPVVRFNEIQVEIDVIIDRAVSVSNPVIAGVSDDTIFNMNDEISLNLDVDANEVLDLNMELQYAEVSEPDDWMSLGTTLAVLNAGVSEVTFSNLGLVSGFYNFKAIVSDLAVPANHTDIDLASTVYFDASAPGITLDIQPQADPNNPLYEYELGALVTIEGLIDTWKSGTTPEVELVPNDVASVEFKVNGVSHDVITTAPYTYVWNTALLANVGTYTIEAIVTDDDGFTNNVLQDVVVVTPDENDPYAVITGFEFDNEAISSDVMYAKVTNWGNNVTAVVAQYYTSNNGWVDFAINSVNNDPYYEFDFNAEAISNADSIKVLVIMNNGAESSYRYSIDANDFNFGLTEDETASEYIEIHENNILVIDETISMPNVIRIDENGYAGYETINEDNEFDLVVNANNELPGYWLSGVANDAAWIKFVELDAMAASNGNTVEYNNPYWFAMLDNDMPLADHYTPLTDQVLVQSNIAGNAVYTLPLTGTVADQGNVVALAWDAVIGDFVEIDVEYNETDATMTFTAPVNRVVTVAEFVLHSLEFAYDIDMIEIDGADWTHLQNASVEVSLDQDEETQGLQLPVNFGLANISVTLNDDVNNVTSILLNNGVLTFDLAMNAGENELMVNVDSYGYHASHVETFFVDNSLPTIQFAVENISVENNTLTATMEDLETGLVDYSLVVTNNDPAVNAVINVPMNDITVSGNEFSYDLTVDELVYLVPQPIRSREVASLNVQWTAVNNLNQVNVMAANVIANVVVNRPTITILNDGFENGWWVNPAMSNQVLMTVEPGDGEIELENINVSILAITDLNPAGILMQTSNPESLEYTDDHGNVQNEDEYQFGFAQLQLPNSLGLKIRVNAVDDLGVNNVAEQTFSLDYMDPVVTATAPANPIVNYGTDVQIAFSFTDPQGHFLEEVNGVFVQHYSGASGINSDSVKLTLDGEVVIGEVNNGSVVYAASDLTPGAHTAVASVTDHVGNTGSATINFEIVGGPAPVVDFTPVGEGGSWWITTTQNSKFNLTVESGHTATDIQSLVATIIEMPNNQVIQGPFSVAWEQAYDDNDNPIDGLFSGTINFHGGIVSPGQNSVRVEVVAENEWNIQTVTGQTYPIDNSRPELTIVNPVPNYSVLVGNGVNVQIVADDNMSGLAMSSIKVSGLNNDSTWADTTLVTPESFNFAIPAANLVAGTYVIEAKAKDNAGNITTVTRNFQVTAPAPIINISALEASNGWVNTQNNNAIRFTVDGNGSDLDNTSIMASVIAMPSNEVIYEPFTIQAIADTSDVYYFNLNVHGGVIPEDANTIKVVVMASNLAGGNSVSNQSYPIDSYSPTIEFVSPVVNATFTHAENMFVDVMIELSDIMPEVKAMASSGLDRLEMKVFDNNNLALIDTTHANVSNSYACRVPVNGVGQYRIEATIYDRAGNSTTKMMNFMVEIDWSNVDLMFTAKPYMYPSPLTRGDVGTFVIPTSKEAQVTIEIFDFAGKLVREMSHNSLGGDTNNMIQFDGRTDDGKRLARGAYFARIRVVDGAKEINKVVKIAIQ